MAPKRKKSPMALLQDDLPDGSDSTPEMPSRRRSTRGKKETIFRDHPDTNLTDKDNSSSTTAQSRNGKQKGRGRGEVDRAIDRLHHMERTLQDSVKRQKLAIKSTVFMNGTEEEDENLGLKPQVIKPNPKAITTPNANGKTKTKKPEPAPDVKKNSGVDAQKDHNEAERDVSCCEGDETIKEDVAALKAEGARPPPVNSDYLPLPWKGRLGYACLNTYLRASNPAVFSSRTCRIASIIEHRHPLRDPSQPEHATKNRPDREQPSDIVRGQRWVENLGLANARDIIKMIRWNDKYGIKFMRLSSEMFPFASHEEYGYKLEPFAAETLAAAGKVAAELGHRLTTHPGQFTQLGSPRKEVVKNAIRDLEFHNEMLTLLKLPEQQNRDAVMILHMGGVFGDREATLQRFRENYAKLSPGIKARLVLENDDVSWSVHDLLPICEELNIPLVLDYHHHNIVFNKEQIREGTKDIMDLYPRIKATWDRKRITQKMHYSEPCSEAITPRQRRKHRPRVMTLPPCADTMDLMIEAKDKEQSVFDLMRTYKLPGWDSFNDIVPYERDDENKPPPKPKAAKKKRKSKKATKDEDEDEDVDMEDVAEEVKPPPEIPPEEVGMGGPNRRVYWPVGMEEWLRPKKREVKPKAKKEEDTKNGTKKGKKAVVKEEEDDDGDEI